MMMMMMMMSRLRVGVYNQHFVERLPMEEDPVTYLRRLFNEETYQTGNLLLIIIVIFIIVSRL